jgi:RNHCP domain
MVPVGYFVRRNGEYALVHRCAECGAQRHNRIAADDDFALVLRLPDLTRQQRSGQLAAVVEALGGAPA